MKMLWVSYVFLDVVKANRFVYPKSVIAASIAFVVCAVSLACQLPLFWHYSSFFPLPFYIIIILFAIAVICFALLFRYAKKSALKSYSRTRNQIDAIRSAMRGKSFPLDKFGSIIKEDIEKELTRIDGWQTEFFSLFKSLCKVIVLAPCAVLFTPLFQILFSDQFLLTGTDFNTAFSLAIEILKLLVLLLVILMCLYSLLSLLLPHLSSKADLQKALTLLKDVETLELQEATTRAQTHTP